MTDSLVYVNKRKLKPPRGRNFSQITGGGNDIHYQLPHIVGKVRKRVRYHHQPVRHSSQTLEEGKGGGPMGPRDREENHLQEEKKSKERVPMLWKPLGSSLNGREGGGGSFHQSVALTECHDRTGGQRKKESRRTLRGNKE